MTSINIAQNRTTTKSVDVTFPLLATAIGIHPLIGYLSPSHLAPAVTAAVLFIAGLVLSAGPMGGLRVARSVEREVQTDRAAERRSTV